MLTLLGLSVRPGGSLKLAQTVKSVQLVTMITNLECTLWHDVVPVFTPFARSLQHKYGLFDWQGCRGSVTV